MTDEVVLLQDQTNPGFRPSGSYSLLSKGKSLPAPPLVKDRVRRMSESDLSSPISKTTIQVDPGSEELQKVQDAIPSNEEKTIQVQQGLIDNVAAVDETLVVWDGPDDPEKPMNWPMSKKWLIVTSSGLMTFTVSFGSSIFSTTLEATAKLFSASQEVMALGVALYVLGFGLGEGF